MATTERIKRPQRLPCGECHKETLHDLLKEDRVVEETEVDHGVGESDYIWEATKNEMFKCRGCNAVMLRRTWRFSESDFEEVRYFPPPVARTKPRWFGEVPPEVRELLSEIYRCLDADTRALPMMGARAVLDRVITDTIGDAGSFKEKLERLVVERHISVKGGKMLNAALDAGSAAAHRGYAPKEEQVQAVMDIVEHLVQSTYILEEVANAIAKDTPQRPPREGK